MEKYHKFLGGEDEGFAPLKETEFLVGGVYDMMIVTDPWRNGFHEIIDFLGTPLALTWLMLRSIFQSNTCNKTGRMWVLPG